MGKKGKSKCVTGLFPRSSHTDKFFWALEKEQSNVSWVAAVITTINNCLKIYSRKISHIWKERKMLFCTSILHGSKTEIWRRKQFITLHHVDLKMSEYREGAVSPKRKSASVNKTNQWNVKLKINKKSILTKISKCLREMDACNAGFCSKNNGKIKGHKVSKQMFCSTKGKGWRVFIIWLPSQVRKELLVHINTEGIASEGILKITALFREEERVMFWNVI